MRPSDGPSVLIITTEPARVERLAAVCGPEPEPEPLIVHWKNFAQQCPSCAAPVFLWAEPLTTCPHCGAPLPVIEPS